MIAGGSHVVLTIVSLVRIIRDIGGSVLPIRRALLSTYLRFMLTSLTGLASLPASKKKQILVKTGV
ncbi:hypothetical protein FR483_n749L [Paramecium bursaria Chlorella virus FR483]|uniref:Uncharacterized protein n749L n=1 Tax=Paramecium bursaria Chlorella virus FR483 TaxID=399781 RepID=A7J8A3_PBCVF|nr:hypothetical protein FR483_n749L [Paramecium bursaria Chlorella virus FR483]ABT16034.1 hypothetical protein FR483_n749L [Paramecium bursaria Chlorella virus FR483]